MPFLPCVIRKLAWNQVESGSFVCSNTVPAVSDVCRPHPPHCRRSLCSSRKCFAQPQEGHLNPEGQRSFASASAHFSAVPKSSRNIVMLIPFWNWTRFSSPWILPECLFRTPAYTLNVFEWEVMFAKKIHLSRVVIR